MGSTNLCVQQTTLSGHATMTGNKKVLSVETGPRFGLCFELETIAFRGRHVLYEACEAALNQKKMKLTHDLFRQCFIERPLNEALARCAALQGKKISTEKMSADIKKQYEKRMLDEANKLNGAFRSLLAELEKEDIALGALASLPEESATVLVGRLGLAGAVQLAFVGGGIDKQPAREHWLELAGKMKIHSHNCLALISCAASSFSVLASNMRSVVLPDEFTLFQDFAGADMVAEEIGDLSADTLLDLLRPRPDIIGCGQ